MKQLYYIILYYIIVLKFIFKEKLYSCLKKDNMEIKLERYRFYGAKIGRIRTFSPISSAESYLISIDDNTTISTGVRFITHDNSIIKFFENGTDLVGAISIGKNCFVGANTIILPGVTISDNIIIAAGSCVTKSFYEENIIIAGNPAKKIGDIESFKEKYKEYIFNFKGLSSYEKRILIEKNLHKLLKK